MYEITYYSIARPNLDTRDIEAILKTARAFNAKQDITGCLLFHNHQFIQILEGDRRVLEDLLSNIKKDTRHHTVFALSDSEKDKRAFSDWTMAYRELSNEDMDGMKGDLFINNFLTFSELASKPTRTVRTFWERVQRLLTDEYTR
jgi:hypothetical protein